MSDQGDALNTALASRYRLERELGRGGMATVYLAEDLKHHRQVAIKVLKPELTASLGAERFLREITIAAKLHHPNILMLIDSGDADGFLYYVMPYVEGESLRDRLTREPQLPLGEAVAIARDVAEGLDHAHAQDIVHRDIKPENILFDSGRWVITDFGVARAVTTAGGEKLTETGIAVGTPHYMSPEQASGAAAIDSRADIYALGCVVYEMLGGEPPFTGSTPQAILSRQVTDPVPNLRTLRTTVPEGVVQAIERALNKSPVDRFATAVEFSTALSAAPTAAPRRAEVAARGKRRNRLALLIPLAAVGLLLIAGVVFLRPVEGTALVRNRVVVAPLENRTGDSALDRIGLIAADWITNGVARMGVAQVVPAREALAALRMAGVAQSGDVDRSLPQVLAEETGAAILVTGSYHPRGDELEFQAQIMDMIEGAVLAALEPEQGAKDDPMAAIDQLQTRVLGAVAAHFGPGGLTEMAGSIPTFQAYQAYLDARDHIVRFEWPEAVEDLRRTIALDSTFVRAYLRLATAPLWNQRKWGAMDSLVQVIERRFDNFTPVERAHLDRVKARVAGDLPQVLAAARRQAELEPGMSQWVAAFHAWQDNRPREAIEYLESMDPDRGVVRDWFPYWNILAASYERLGEYREVLEVIERAKQRFPNLFWPRAEMLPLAALGRVGDVEKRLDDAIERGYLGSALSAAWALRAFGHLEASTRAARRVVEYFETHDSTDAVWEPNDLGGQAPGLQLILADALSLEGRFDEAERVYHELAQQFPDRIYMQGRLGIVAAHRGDTAEARRIAQELEAWKRPYLWGQHLAWSARIAAAQGDGDGAVRLLERAFSEGLEHHPAGSRSDYHGVEALEWWFEPIRDYPPFRELMRPKG